MNKLPPVLILIFLYLSCSPIKNQLSDEQTTTGITTLSFVDEYVIPNETVFDDTRVGGLSGIDYANGKWYVICDNRNFPRFYEFDMKFTEDGFQSVDIINVTTLSDITNSHFVSGMADPESIRVINTSRFIWSSEGNISRKVNPFLRIADISGRFIDSITLPKRFTVEQDGIKGPRNNGVFEALTQDHASSNFWTATELPLEEDGDVPTSTAANAPIRIAYIDMTSKTVTKEFAYRLDKVARKGDFEINGVTEILSYDVDSFLILERSYAKGYKDGGNNIKIYKAHISQATDVSTLSDLTDTEYSVVHKELLFDFESIRSQLSNGIIDNIEGMTFGPNFTNGNRSLVLVSDNNFNKNQVTQLILLEVK